MIRLASPEIREDDLRAVRDVLASGWLVQGKHVAEFEDSVAQFLEIDHAVALNSGTSALHAALLALGIRPGKAVAVSAYSHVASANAIEMCGGEPVFVDIDPRTFNMDAEQLDRVLSERGGESSVAAIIVVHAFGQMADLDAIEQIAERFGVPVVEDAACALGAKWADRQPGHSTSAACFSFHPRKAITTGEGGLFATHERDLANRVRALRNHGQDADNPTPDFVLPGLNYRMTEFQAVLGIAALRRLRKGIARRREVAAQYDALLETLVEAPQVPDRSEPVYQSYVVLLPAEIAAAREDLIGELAAAGVEATIGTWNIPMTTYYRERYGYVAASYPVASDIFERSLAIPMHENLDAEDQSHVVSALRTAINHVRETCE